MRLCVAKLGWDIILRPALKAAPPGPYIVRVASDRFPVNWGWTGL